MTRLLLLNTDLERGGTPTVVRELAIRLRPLGFQTVVACLSTAGPVADGLRAAGVPVVSFDLPRPRITAAFDATRLLIGTCRRFDVQTLASFLIHGNAVAAAASPWLRGVRRVQFVQTTQPYPRWHWQLQGLIHVAADAVVVPSASVRAVTVGYGVPGEKVLTIPNAVDVSPDPPTELPSSRPVGGRVRIGFLGRLDPIKRVDRLLAATAVLPGRYELHVFGDGPERDRLRAVASPLGGRVTFHGTIASSAEAWDRVDLLVLPSRAEGFGLVLIEAMAAGVPVIAGDVPGVRDVVRHGYNGLLTDVQDADRLAATIRRVATDDALRQRLVRGGREDVRRRFAWDRVLPAYARLLRP